MIQITAPVCIIVLALSAVGCDNSQSAAPPLQGTSDEKQASFVAASHTENTNQNPDKNTVNSASSTQTSADTPSVLSAAQSDDEDMSSKDTFNRRQTPMVSSDGDNSMLQATLIGDYMGMVTCSHCDEREVLLNLYSDGSMLKTTQDMADGELALPVKQSGVYRQDKDVITVVYDNQEIETYQIEGNRLIRHQDGADIAIKTPDPDYSLSRQ